MLRDAGLGETNAAAHIWPVALAHNGIDAAYGNCIRRVLPTAGDVGDVAPE